MSETINRLTADEIDAAMTPAGGWKKETLAGWGIPWPPPKGWRAALLGDQRPTAGHNNPPSEVDPEKLVDTAALAALLAANYSALQARADQFNKSLTNWDGLHLVARPADYASGKIWPVQYAIRDDADLKKTSDFAAQLSAFAGGRAASSGEVNEAREKVKRAPFDACKIIDGFFNAMRENIRNRMTVIDGAQTAYLQKKAADERRERERLAVLAQEEADRAAAAARAADAANAPEVDERVHEAVQAEDAADAAFRAAQASRADLVRSTSMGGTTTTLRSNWTVEVIDLMALVLEVAAGRQPLAYLQANEAVLRAAVKAKGGMRVCPGLKIFDDARVARTGRSAG